jgi:tetratricopeptide (TPR) repeat protein
VLRPTHRRLAERMLHFMRTAGAEPRLFFAVAAETELRQSIMEALQAGDSIELIQTVISPGDPVPKSVREHKGTHANTKLFVVEGLSEAIDRGGDGFFRLLVRDGGLYTNYGTWTLLWLRDVESRLRLEREAPRLFQAATMAPVFFSPALVEPNPGKLPELAVPSPLAGDPEGRLSALSALVRRKDSPEDRVTLAEELIRLGEGSFGEEQLRIALAHGEGEVYRVRALRALYARGKVSWESLVDEAKTLFGEARAEALLLVADIAEKEEKQEIALKWRNEAIGLSVDNTRILVQSLLAKAAQLRRAGKLEEALRTLAMQLPSPQSVEGVPGNDEAMRAPVLSETSRLQLELAFESDASEAQKTAIQKQLEQARFLALSARPTDYETAQQADIYLSGLYFAREDAKQALGILDVAKKRAESAGFFLLALECYRLRMNALFDLGENSQAMAELTMAVRLARQIGYPDALAEILSEQAHLEASLGNRDKAKLIETEAETLRTVSKQ